MRAPVMWSWKANAACAGLVFAFLAGPFALVYAVYRLLQKMGSKR